QLGRQGRRLLARARGQPVEVAARPVRLDDPIVEPYIDANPSTVSETHEARTKRPLPLRLGKEVQEVLPREGRSGPLGRACRRGRRGGKARRGRRGGDAQGGGTQGWRAGRR